MGNKGDETSLIICGNLVKSASILEENTMIVNTPIFCLVALFFRQTGYRSALIPRSSASPEKFLIGLLRFH